MLNALFVLVATTLVCLSSSICLSQRSEVSDELTTRYGVYGHSMIHFYDADFLRIPGTASCCEGYTSGSGLGFLGGFLYEIPIASRLLLSARLSASSQPFSLVSSESTFLSVDGEGRDGTFEHRLNGDFTTIGVDPVVSYGLSRKFLVSLGFRVASIIGSTYQQLEQLVEPSDVGTFLNPDGSDSRSRTRNIFNGELPNPSLQVAGLVGLSYEMPLNRTGSVLLVPEVFYQYAFTNVISEVAWKAHSLRAGLALKFVTTPVMHDDEPIDTKPSERMAIVPPPPPPPVIVKVPALNAMISSVGVERDGTEKVIATMRVEEFSATLMTPLLGYVFFDAHSADIPSRYSRMNSVDAMSFDENKVNSENKLSTYHHVLNIVGARMQANPSASITITGFTDGATEKGDVELSTARAHAVRSYLMSSFGIRPDRITVAGKSLPSTASTSQTEDGNQENRRVEITSTSDAILAPVITSDTIRTSNPPTVRFKPTVTGSAGLKSWKITASLRNDDLVQFTGDTALPDNVDWQVTADKNSVPRLDGTLAYTIDVVDSLGSTARNSGSIPIEVVTVHKKRIERRGDIEIDKYSLLLFEVRSAELTQGNKRTLDFIRKRLKPNSSVTVTGYTDQRGDQAYNDKLALERANNTSNVLRGAKTIRAIAKGNTNLYDNSLPEGRFYSRTVDVVAETPISE